MRTGLFILVAEEVGVGLIRYGVSAWCMAKPLVDEASTRSAPAPVGFRCFSTCRAAVASPDPHLYRYTAGSSASWGSPTAYRPTGRQYAPYSSDGESISPPTPGRQ
jgi:hypothetical protein